MYIPYHTVTGRAKLYVHTTCCRIVEAGLRTEYSVPCPYLGAGYEVSLHELLFLYAQTDRWVSYPVSVGRDGNNQ